MHWIQRLYSSDYSGRKFDYFTFFCLYIAQTLPMTFFSTALQVTMRQSQFSLSSIAMLQLIKLPWVLKFLWSPIVDRHCNTMHAYRRCIFLSEIIYAAIILLVGHLDLINDFYFILALVFVSLMASATQDIATDALAVLAFTKREKSLVNSMQSLGSFSATLIGSGVLLALLQRYGWHYVIPFMAVFVLLAIVPLWSNHGLKFVDIAPLLQHPTLAESPAVRQEIEQQEREVRKMVEKRASKVDFLWFFATKGIWRQIGFLMLYYAGIIGSLSVLRPYMVDLGYSMKEIGVLSGVGGSAGACVASLLSGFMIRRWGRRWSRRLIAVLTLCATSYLYFMTMGHPSTTELTVGVIGVWLCYGFSTVVVYTTAMDYVRRGREGTDFTVQTVLTHLSGLLVSMLSGKVADTFGYHNLFLFETALALTSLLYVWMIFGKEDR